MKRISITVDDDAIQIEREGMDTYETIGVLEAAKTLILIEAKVSHDSGDNAAQTKKVLPEG